MPDEARETKRVEKTGSTSHVGVGQWAGLLFVALLALGLRAYGLTAGGLNLDEGYSLIQSERSVFDIFMLNRFDANPPFYILTLHCWRALVGDSEWALKSLSMFAGVAGVIAVWFAARERFGAVAGLGAAWFVSLNAFHIHYAQEIRGYSLLFGAVAIADFAFVRWHRVQERRVLWCWGLATFYAVNVHHFAWYFVAVQALSVIVQPSDNAARRVFVRAIGLVVLLSSPMLASFVIHLVVYQRQNWIPLRDLENLVVILAAMAGRMPLALLAWGLASLALVAVSLPRGRLASLLTRVEPPLKTDRMRAVLVPGLELLLPVWLFVGSQLWFPMLLPRYCVIALLPLAVLVGGGFACLRPRSVSLVAAGVLAGLAVAPIQALYANETKLAHLEVWAEAVEAGYRAGDVVVYTDKHIFVPAIARHPAEWNEFLLPELSGHQRSAVLANYTSREVRRPALEPGEYSRLWVVKRKAEAIDRVLRDPMFAYVSLRLIRRVPETEVYLFALNEGSSR